MLYRHKKHHGFTLIELMIVLAITAILLAIAVPSFNDFFVKNRVRRAAIEVQGLVAKAKAETVIRDSDLFMSYTAGVSDDWCIGYSATTSCDCTESDPTAAGSCAVSIAGTLVNQRIVGTEFPDITLAETFVGTGSTFDAVRGTSTAGTLTLNNGNFSLAVKVSLNGRVRICAPSGSEIYGYPPC